MALLGSKYWVVVFVGLVDRTRREAVVQEGRSSQQTSRRLKRKYFVYARRSNYYVHVA